MQPQDMAQMFKYAGRLGVVPDQEVLDAIFSQATPSPPHLPLPIKDPKPQTLNPKRSTTTPHAGRIPRGRLRTRGRLNDSQGPVRMEGKALEPLQSSSPSFGHF